MNQRLRRLIDQTFPQAVRLRRIIHANPELSGSERQTAGLVFRFLSEIGLKPRYHLDKTGVAARIINGSGKTVVLRADMDALPIEEQTGLPYRSRHKGTMHACGHDVHTACLLGAARVLSQLKDLWKGTIVVLFQPSEEAAPGGALGMIREHAFPDKVDAVFGLHVSTDCVVGQVGIKPGRDFSGVLDFEVIVSGKGGHGAAPHKAIDPIVCACSIILELQTLISRESPAHEPSVLTVGSFHAGTKQNIIPDRAFFSGTIRTFSGRHQSFLMQRVREIVLSTARSFKASGSVVFEKSYPPGFNDEKLSHQAARVAGGLLGKNRVKILSSPTMYAEDFAYYQQRAPGLFMHLGVARPGDRDPAGIHTSRFNPDERAIKTGIAMHAGMAIDILS